ncbi:MAG: PQQ-binding-like beta-propeller repeat protein [Methanoregula sp.]|jgi:hypothetical protein|nr:PQQ-binding-like beta-propeller repeat protein [Methanoregula sp.]
MKSPVSGIPAITVFIVIGLCIAATGCIGGERLAVTDILVSKYDAGGQNVWSTKIDTGKQDYATAVIETADNGYALAGWIADGPRGPYHPRIIRLNETGGIVWDRILDTTSDEVVAIAEAPEGGLIAALKSGKVCKVDNNGRPVWNRTVEYTINSIIPIRDGGYALAGSHTLGLDRNGSLVWDQPYTSTSIIQAADGGFFVERSGVPYNYGELFHLGANGTWVWTQSVDGHENGKITSLHETQEGAVEVIYTYPDRMKDKDLVMYMESEQITFGKNGTATVTIPLVAVDPVTRISDGGYLFEAYPFPASAAFTTLPHATSNLHLVRLSPKGEVVWDRSLDLPQWVAPQEILETRDGGFVTLVVPGS